MTLKAYANPTTVTFPDPNSDRIAVQWNRYTKRLWLIFGDSITKMEHPKYRYAENAGHAKRLAAEFFSPRDGT